MSQWKLFDQKTNEEINTGDKVVTFRDEPCVVVGFFYPHKPNASGKVYVQFDTGEEGTYYAGVINAEYRRVK
jgi:hypothetical protein